MALGVTGGGGGTGRSATTGEALRWFSAEVPVPRRQRGGKVWAGIGDHGGRVNLAGGCLGWPVHGEVAGVRGGGSPARLPGQ
jgi:hypothetical protein